MLRGPARVPRLAPAQKHSGVRVDLCIVDTPVARKQGSALASGRGITCQPFGKRRYAGSLRSWPEICPFFTPERRVRTNRTNDGRITIEIFAHDRCLCKEG